MRPSKVKPTKKLKDRTLRTSGFAHDYLTRKAFKERKTIKQVLDEMCSPKRIPIKGSVS